MRQTILGVFVGLFLAGVGVVWWQGRAQVETLAPPPPEPEAPAPDPTMLPIADPDGLEGPAPPEASELTREEKRGIGRKLKRFRVKSVITFVHVYCANFILGFSLPESNDRSYSISLFAFQQCAE